MGCKWSSLDAPATENPLSHSVLKFEEFPFHHYWPSGVIRIGLPEWKWKSCKNLETKVAQWAANGPDWMPKALKTLCVTQFWSWKNSLFPLLTLWGNKNFYSVPHNGHAICDSHVLIAGIHSHWNCTRNALKGRIAGMQMRRRHAIPICAFNRPPPPSPLFQFKCNCAVVWPA